MMRSNLVPLAAGLMMLAGCAPGRQSSLTGGTTGAGGGPGSGGSLASGGAATTLGQGASVAGGGGAEAGGSVLAGGAGAGGKASGAGGGVAGSGGASPAGGASGASGSGGSVAPDAAAGGQSGAGGGGTSAAGGQAGSGGAAGSSGTGPQGPCDIYQGATPPTPCVAAHSTVRALYGAYTGPLYQVRNAANSLKDIPVGADGYVDISVQDTFCSGTTCTIATIYDQSPNKNNLTKSPTCLWLPNGGVEANATQGKISINGHTAYGVYVDNTGNQSNSVGYRNNSTKGVPTGDNPEATYMVLDGTRSSSICCFDYGNVETDGKDDGNATMEAIYWGTDSQFGQSGGGNGPWVAADLENGMFEGYENGSEKVPSNTSITGWTYVTAMLKGLSAS